jgi:hypothetical protein
MNKWRFDRARYQPRCRRNSINLEPKVQVGLLITLQASRRIRHAHQCYTKDPEIDK